MLIRRLVPCLFCVLTASLSAAQPADDDIEVLEPVLVIGQRIANVHPASSFAAPVTGLRYDPQIDVQARGLPEGQADITIRGGLFENTGFRLGAVTIFDPQTGHYAAELPLAPAMLSAPEVLTDIDHGLSAFNASVGSVQYGFNRVHEGGVVDMGLGSDGLLHAEVRAGRTADRDGGRRLGALISAAGSRGDGTLPNGDHEFKRFSGQLQLLAPRAETNLLLGYHDKFFGWPGAYTGFASLPETDHTKLGLVVFDHRQNVEQGWWELGVAYRRLVDDYDFDRRTVETGVPGSFEHETRSVALGLLGERHAAGLDWSFSSQLVADHLVRSTDLTHGNFNSRSYLSLSLAPGRDWSLGSERVLSARAGLRADLSNRDENALMPLFGLSLEQPLGSGVSRVGLEYSRGSQLPGYTALNSAPTGLFGGNAELGREYADSLSLSASYETAAWTVRAALFGRRDDDLVDWTYRQGAPFARQANAVDIDVLGAELMFFRYGEKLDVVAAGSWIDKEADYGSALVDASFYALNYARQRLTLALVMRPVPWLDFRVDSEYRRQRDNPLRKSGDDAFIAAFSASSALPFGENTRLRLVVDNATDSDFEEFPGTPAVGRQISLELRLGW